MNDRWGQEMSGTAETIVAWDEAWGQFLHFRGDPVAELEASCRDDETNVLGPVFLALYAVLAGSPLDSSAPAVDVERARARSRAATEREAAHVAALDALMRGDFTVAGDRWARIARDAPDFAAIRFAHDVFLHVGDADRRLTSSQAAFDNWGDRPGASFVAGQHSFALEEVGRYSEAEAVGRAALEADPDDLWARHALAHVYESIDDSAAALALLRPSVERWSEQELLATHVWWHLAIRLLAVGEVDAAFEIFDERLPSSTTPFRLCDQSALLWRLELAGHDTGDRWDALADRWDGVVERHTCGFLDLHATLAFVRRPRHPGAAHWFDGLAARPGEASENDRVFDEVVVPLVAAFRAFASGDHARFLSDLDSLGTTTARIGGSVAQRDIIELTRQAAGATK